MSFLDPQNPGIGGLEELTDNEQTFVQNLSSLSYVTGDILYYNGSALTRLPIGSESEVLTVVSGIPSWEAGGAGSLDGSGTTNEITYWVDSNTLGALAVATYPSLAELAYVKGVTSGIQSQLNGKAASLGADDNYVTDAEKTKLANLSGTNTGDQTNITGNAATVTTNANLTGVVTSVGNATAIADAALSIAKTSGLQTALDAKAPLASPTFTGTVTLPTVTAGGVITLSENSSIALDPAGSADGKYSGITVTGIAGYTQAFGDLVYLAVADSRWEAADADAVGTAGTVMLAMVVSAGTDGNACTLLLQGIIRADAKFPALTVGAPVYAGETAGAIQVAIPTGADNVIRVVGFALTADEIYFNPSPDHQTTVA